MFNSVKMTVKALSSDKQKNIEAATSPHTPIWGLKLLLVKASPAVQRCVLRNLRLPQEVVERTVKSKAHTASRYPALKRTLNAELVREALLQEKYHFPEGFVELAQNSLLKREDFVDKLELVLADESIVEKEPLFVSFCLKDFRLTDDDANLYARRYADKLDKVGDIETVRWMVKLMLENQRLSAPTVSYLLVQTGFAEEFFQTSSNSLSVFCRKYMREEMGAVEDFPSAYAERVVIMHLLGKRKLDGEHAKVDV